MVVIIKPPQKTPLPTPSLCSQVGFGQKKDLIESWLVAASILLILILCCNASNWISSFSIFFSERNRFMISHNARHSIQDTEWSGSGSMSISTEATNSSNEGSMGAQSPFLV